MSCFLGTLLQLPWLGTHAGGVFLADRESRNLTLAAQINLAPSVKTTCARVDYGHCLCGQVAETAEFLHVSCVDERHETRYEGMCNHGHYIVPIKLHEQLLGVLVLYLDTDHAYNTSEVQVLERFASIMALQIQTLQMHQEKQLADLILAHSAHGVMITDQDMRIQWVNPAFEKLSGYAVEEALGMRPSMFSSDRHGADFYAAMWQSIKTQGFWEGEIWNRRKNGEIYPEWLNIVALKNELGEILRYAGIFIDLSPIKAAEEKIHRLAYYDSVTGLLNASRLHEKLEQMLSRSRKDNKQIIVFMLDLDRFHEINAGLGRRIGDAVLQETACRISRIVEGSVVARMSADEFVVTFPEPDGGDDTPVFASHLAETFNKQMRTLFEFEQHELMLECSVGISWGNGQDTGAEDLLKRTAIALAHCKIHSRNGYQLHNQEMEQQADYQRFLGRAIGKAIERDELFLLYQPQLDRQGRVVGAEVLLRWHSKEYGNIPPDVFIGIAEERGAIIDIGRWVLERTLEQMACWRDTGVCHSGCIQRLAINVSPHQILSEHIVEEFSSACNAHGFDPGSIELEVTETGLMQSSDHVIKQLNALSELGFKIAIDDFGTGHSSLSRLRNFPLHVLKIDRSFVNNMATHPPDAALVKAIIDMAHTMGFRVVAEGVEEAAQFDMLMEFGCDIFQGYYFSKPICADKFLEYLKQGPHKDEMAVAN